MFPFETSKIIIHPYAESPSHRIIQIIVTRSANIGNILTIKQIIDIKGSRHVFGNVITKM